MALHGIAVLSLIGIVQIVIGQQPLFGWQGNQNPVAPLRRGLDVPPFQRWGFGRDSFFGDRNGFGNEEEISEYISFLCSLFHSLKCPYISNLIVLSGVTIIISLRTRCKNKSLKMHFHHSMAMVIIVNEKSITKYYEHKMLN